MTDWLVDTLFATSALMLMVLLIREPVRRHFGARTAYALWLLPAARALMPAISQTVERVIPAPSAGSSPSPFIPAVVMEPRLMGSVAPAEFDLVAALGGWSTIALVVWIGAAMGLILRGLCDYRRQRAEILRDGVQLARLGDVRLVRSPAVRGPTAFGLFDRVIAVPADFERRYGDRERRLALAHELAHHRHGDLVTNSFAFVLLSLQWFNPLAWWSYAAFRFDQEAACDARVLDKACPTDRADYGRAIAKAASGRALLLASALDSRKTLHRRLKSMLNTTTRTRRVAGIVTILAATAIVLPLTATRAINYVDVNAPAAPAVPTGVQDAAAPETPEAPEQPQAAETAEPVWTARSDVAQAADKQVWNGEQKMAFEKMTPEQRNEMRRELGEARAELARSREEAWREMAEARAEAERDMVEARRDVAEANREAEAAVREIDANAAELRKAGQDPEALKALVRSSMKKVETIDVGNITSKAMASVDERTIEQSLRKAEASIAAMEAELDRLDRK